MGYRYFHDAVQRCLYRQSDVPEVFPKQASGKLAGWRIRLEIDVVRADNWVNSQGRWNFETSEYPDQFFDSLRYSRDDALRYFIERNSAERKSTSTEEIDETRYEQFKAVYSAEARANRGAS